MAGSLVAYLASLRYAAPLHLAAPAEPATYGLGVRWTDPLLIACAIVPAVLFALARRDAGGRARIGCLGWLLRLGTLWAGANVMAYPAGVLMYLGTAELSRHPEAWLVTAASPFAALAMAWWFRPAFPPLRVPYLLLRAHGDHADVLKITSQDKTRLDSHIHLPLEKWHRVLDKESWLELRVTETRNRG